MRTNSRNWDPIGLNDPIAQPQPLELLICNSAVGQFQLGQMGPAIAIRAIGQLAIQPNPPIQFSQFNEGNLVGRTEEAELMPSLSSGRRVMTWLRVTVLWFLGETRRVINRDAETFSAVLDVVTEARLSFGNITDQQTRAACCRSPLT